MIKGVEVKKHKTCTEEGGMFGEFIWTEWRVSGSKNNRKWITRARLWRTLKTNLSITLS